MASTLQPLFRLESEMAAPVTSWLDSQNLLVKQEFSLPWGICDLVGVKLRKRSIAKRLAYRQTKPIGPAFRIELLANIPDVDTDCSITLDRLQLCVGSTAEAVVAGVEQLHRDRFVVFSQRGHVQKVNGWAPMHGRIVAVELKLDRVMEALNQAVTNKGFASESFVALPMAIAKRITNDNRSKLFRAEGVGLLGVEQDGCSILIRPMRSNDQDEILAAHCAERFWRTRDTAS